MSDPTPARPTQVTLAGWLVVVGSVLVVLMSFSEVAALRSLETREAVEKRVADSGGDVLGLDVQGVLTAMRVLLMVAAASAAATAILGWQALQRSKGARVALSVCAVPLFAAGLVQQGGLVSAMVTAAIVMLWFQPARDWFDGTVRTPPPAPLPPAPRERVGHDPLLDLPPPTAPPLHPTAYADRPAGGPTRQAAVGTARPSTVTWACLLTWLFSVPALALFAATLVAMVADPQQMVDEMHAQSPEAAEQFTDSTLRAVLYATSAGIVLWSVAAVALAVLVWRRVRWAVPLLMVSAAGAAVLCLLAVVGSLVAVVPLAACAATLALLLRPESRAWLSP
jgi:hypothetical protein